MGLLRHICHGASDRVYSFIRIGSFEQFSLKNHFKIYSVIRVNRYVVYITHFSLNVQVKPYVKHILLFIMFFNRHFKNLCESLV